MKGAKLLPENLYLSQEYTIPPPVVEEKVKLSSEEILQGEKLCLRFIVILTSDISETSDPFSRTG